jgi:RNA polymerase sigma-70 factor (ECF subfamily)
MAAAEPSLFPPTRWTLVERVRAGAGREAQDALEILCRAYWQPLYCVARGRGFAEADAKDAVQGFFECLLRRETFGTAEESAGRLRNFLLGAFGHYCVQQWRKAACQKRGGTREHVSLDDVERPADLERKFLHSAGQDLTPEVLYKREWATAVLERSWPH